MRIKLAFCLVCALLSSCISNTDIDKIPNYQIHVIDNKIFDWDSVAQIEKVIPLETRDNSITDDLQKGIIEGNSFYFMDQSQNLLMFSMEGKFLGQIGQKGRGPGEYRELNDFMISDQILYMLDYEKIHLFNIPNGNYINSIELDQNRFNTSKFIIYDSTRFYLWDTNPYQVIPNGSGFRLQKVINGNIVAEYFKYDHAGMDGLRFSKNQNMGYNLYPAEDDNSVYQITRDSLFLSYKLDFGNKFLPKDYFQNKPEWKEYFASDYFKGISNIFETTDYIYFTCTGPKSIGYEGLINKKTERTIFGTRNISSPSIFYADEKYLYGYFEPYYIKRFNTEINYNPFLKSILPLISNVSSEDNIIVVKINLIQQRE